MNVFGLNTVISRTPLRVLFYMEQSLKVLYSESKNKKGVLVMNPSFNELRKEINNWRKNFSFPDISPEKFNSYYKEFPLWMCAKNIQKPNQMISLEKIYGDNWCFESKQTRGNYPKPSKLLSLLEGYEKNASIPPIDLYLIEGNYYFSEGNHRVYLSTLLGKKEILANVWEVFYDEFLHTSSIYREDSLGGVIEFEDELYEVDINDLRQYKKRKGL